jgi:ATP-binding cassette subfamily B protein
MSPTLTWYALSPLPLLSLSIFLVNNKIERRSEEIQKRQSGLSTFVQEAFSGIRVLKSFNREHESFVKFEKENESYRKHSLKLTKVQSLFYPLIMGLIGLSTILTIYAGSKLVIEGTLTFGNIAEYIIYVNLLTWPVTSLGWTTSLVQRAEASQKRINEFLKTDTNIFSAKNLEHTIEGKIEFKDVSFTYPDIFNLLSSLVNPWLSLEPPDRGKVRSPTSFHGSTTSMRAKFSLTIFRSLISTSPRCAVRSDTFRRMFSFSATVFSTTLLLGSPRKRKRK